MRKVVGPAHRPQRRTVAHDERGHRVARTPGGHARVLRPSRFCNPNPRGHHTHSRHRRSHSRQRRSHSRHRGELFSSPLRVTTEAGYAKWGGPTHGKRVVRRFDASPEAGTSENSVAHAENGTPLSFSAVWFLNRPFLAGLEHLIQLKGVPGAFRTFNSTREGPRTP